MYKIAITGKANSGKNTVGKLLIKSIFNNSLKKTTHFMAFADPIKEMALTAFPQISHKWLYGPSKYRNEIIPGAFKEGVPLTVRQLLIDLGNDFGRRYQSDIWINNFDNRFNKLINKQVEAIIVTDVRFLNEFNHLKKYNFFQIKLLRNYHAKIDDISETNQDEIRNDEFDCILYNNGTLKELKQEVSKIISKIPNE